MTQTRAAAHRKHTHRNTKGVGRLLRGLGVSILTTLVGDEITEDSLMRAILITDSSKKA